MTHTDTSWPPNLGDRKWWVCSATPSWGNSRYSRLKPPGAASTFTALPSRWAMR
jgi:hypothetical protein